MGKRCTKCGVEKSLDEFSFCKAARDGRPSWCKRCSTANSQAWAKKHPDHVKAVLARWYVKNRARALAASAKYSKDHPEVGIKKSRKYRMLNSEQVKLKDAERAAKRRKADPAKSRAALSKWQKANRHVGIANTARHKAAKLRATPAWANKDAILAIYAEARRLTMATGIKHQVDHQVPLRSLVVQGFHCEANLRVITGAENASKKNRHWPDMP